VDPEASESDPLTLDFRFGW